MVNKSQAVFESTTVILLEKNDKSHIKETKGGYVIWYIANGASKEIVHLVSGITFQDFGQARTCLVMDNKK